MEIMLTPEIEQALAEQAQQQGTTPEHLALESLRRQFVVPSQRRRTPTAQGSLADFLADSPGILHSSEYISGGAQMSETKNNAFTEGLIKKRQQGHL